MTVENIGTAIPVLDVSTFGVPDEMTDFDTAVANTDDDRNGNVVPQHT